MKKLLTFMIVWTCLLTLAGCGKKDMDYTMQNESSVAESVRETGEESVLIQNEDAGEGENAAPETKYITIDLSLYQNMPGSFTARNNPAPNEIRLATKEYRV